MSNESSSSKFHLFPDFLFPVLFMGISWLIWAWEEYTQQSLSSFGNFPRKVEQIYGIFTMHFLHGDWQHLFNNSVPMVVLGWAIFYFYRPSAIKIYGWSLVLTGLWVWIAARPNYHIGASGMVYAFASFVFFSGVIRRNANLAALSLMVVFIYGSLVWGIFPIDPQISWEGHLFGGVAGLLLAYNYRSDGPQRKEWNWDEEEGEEDEDWEQLGSVPPMPAPQRVVVRYHYRPETPVAETQIPPKPVQIPEQLPPPEKE